MFDGFQKKPRVPRKILGRARLAELFKIGRRGENRGRGAVVLPHDQPRAVEGQAVDDGRVDGARAHFVGMHFRNDRKAHFGVFARVAHERRRKEKA